MTLLHGGRIAGLIGGLLLSIGVSAFAQQQAGFWEPVGQILGAGSLDGDIFKVWMPRNDFKVTIKAQQIPPQFSLESWAAFKPLGKTSLMRAELVLMQDEVAPAIDSFLNSGIQVTGIHQRLLYESPHVVSLRVVGRGDPVALANTIKSALKNSKVTDKPSTDAIDAADAIRELGPRKEAIEQVLGMEGEITGSVLRFAVPRSERIVEGGIEIPAAMGAASVFSFFATDEERIATTGELVLMAGEVNYVIGVLRSSGVEIAALNNCFVAEKPRLVCVRFWANGDGETLARGLRLVFDGIRAIGKTSSQSKQK